MRAEIAAGRKPGDIGERWFRRLLLAACVVAFAGLAAIAIQLWTMPAPPDNIYFGLQRRAGSDYLLLWMGIAALGAALSLSRRAQFLAFYVVLLIAAEGGAHAYFYLRNGYVYHPISSVLLKRFEPHPLLVGIPRPGTFGPVSHDSEHRRTTVNEGKVANPIYIFAFGGSTTYDIGVRDAETWPSDLSRLLGEGYAVENLGVPGYTSLENMIQSLFAFREIRPACAIYYMGWNDLRNSHILGLKDDYSDFELPAQIGNLGVGRQPGFLENNVLLLKLAFSIFAEKGADYDFTNRRSGPSGQKDERLSKIYMENMRLIADIDRHFGVKPIFVPQVLNADRFKARSYAGWTPLIAAKDVIGLMGAMNDDLAAVASETGTLYLKQPLEVSWTGADFVDDGHFSPAGAEKFAKSIAAEVAANCH